MSCYRKHCTRTAVAMWTIFATALTLASAGTMLTIVIATIALVALASVGAWVVLHRSVTAQDRVTAPASVQVVSPSTQVR